jgi:DNA-binding MarR family transcriptional regulator
VNAVPPAASSARASTRRPSGADAALVDSLLSLSRVLVGLAARTLGEIGAEVTLSQYRALVLLAVRGRQRTGDLAAELGVQSSTVTRLCDRLIRRGLIERVRQPDDRRVAWLDLTGEGAGLVADTMAHRRAAIAELVSSAELEQPAGLAPVLDALVEAAGETTDPDWLDRLAERRART